MKREASLVPRPIPSFSMSHAGNGPGDEVNRKLLKYFFGYESMQICIIASKGSIERPSGFIITHELPHSYIIIT